MKGVKKFVIQSLEDFIINIFTTCELFGKELKEQVIFFFNFIINSTVIIYKCLDISDSKNAENIENLNLLNIFDFLTDIFTADMYQKMKEISNHQITNDQIINLKEKISPILKYEMIKSKLDEYSYYIDYLKYVDYIAKFPTLCQLYIRSIFYFLELRTKYKEITKENIALLSQLLEEKLDLSYSEIKGQINRLIRSRPTWCQAKKITTSSISFLEWLTINEITIPESNEEIDKIINDLDCNTNFIDRNQNEGLTRLDIYNYIAFLFRESPLDLLLIRKFFNSLLICQKLPLISSYGSWITSGNTKDNILGIVDFLNYINSSTNKDEKKNFIQMLFVYIYTNPFFHSYKNLFDLDLCKQINPNISSVDDYISFILGGGYLRYIAKNRGKYKKYNKSRKIMKNYNKKLHLNTSKKKSKKGFKKNLKKQI